MDTSIGFGSLTLMYEGRVREVPPEINDRFCLSTIGSRRTRKARRGKPQSAIFNLKIRNPQSAIRNWLAACISGGFLLW
jgi:hypothetical protein